ncbi:hydantoinase B/oxoprolinase family protein [Chelatococcus asaccharovorans]|uniref:N-methylhydantoinase B n=1 Tax=Chelatococcus asaccharovorans TaxID=28210 RepID=A0A2V3UDV8_9HYPH|nr:hydantoinase B/oxoprolinase family protein [Chelatococcus asaccharovorans]MBS7706938.1 hydantoinase B/oxoprolinase family protein [Chelatococcus asaccharovorans]PXW63117.1 N-methylhydantoinase B [Chelatococcus asaccharovorans]
MSSIEPLDTTIDPVTFSVVWGGLLSTAAEMGSTLLRTAYSMTVREGSDFSTGVFDAEGNMVAQGDYSPGHLGSMAFTVRQMLDYYPVGSLGPGDAVICNDPTIGSGHLPDFFMVTPVYLGERLVGYAVNIAHHIDVGGSAPGSEEVVGVRETCQEGIRFLPTLLFKNGEPNREILRIIEANVRVKDVIGDLHAQFAANMVGANRIRALAEQYGPEQFATCMRQILVQSQEAMLAAIDELPKGTYHFSDKLDDVGPGTEPVHMQMALTIAEDRIICDFEGTGPQREAGMNAYMQYTRSYCIAAVKSVTLPRAPQNFGIIRCIEIRAPQGSFVNPKPGAASGARAVTANRIYEVVMGALAQVVPDRVISASSGFCNPKVSGSVSPFTGKPFLAWMSAVGGVGAHRHRDGQEATTSPTNGTNTPVEVQEMNAPVFIERMELIPDSAGAGRFRGGMALRKDLRLVADIGLVTNLGDRYENQPYGLEGGLSGTCAATVLNPDTPGERYLHSKGTYALKKGDVLSMRTAGAGGFGDPKLRDPARVLSDVRAGLVSIEAARDIYAVAIRTAPLAIDEAATAMLRSATARGVLEQAS